MSGVVVCHTKVKQSSEHYMANLFPLLQYLFLHFTATPFSFSFTLYNLTVPLEWWCIEGQ